MRQKYKPGFTIVEVVLFLAVSGLLMIGLLAATTSAIQQQQYRDAVHSFAGFLRGQYERVVSVENDRAPSDSCPIAAAANRAGRGQSDCLIVGRYIEAIGDSPTATESDGTRYAAYPVYGKNTDTNWEYQLGEQDDSYQINWGAKTKLPSQDARQVAIALLMYRDPESGALIIRSHAGRYQGGTIGHFITGKDPGGTALTGEFGRELCVYDEGWMLGRRQSVFLAARPGSSDAISVGNAEAEGCLHA